MKRIRIWLPLMVALVLAGALVVFARPLYSASVASAAKASAPAVTTQPATVVTSTSATLHGTVNPGGLATTTWFQWQPVDGGANTVKSIGSGTSPAAISAVITGLKPGTAYRYQAAAWNSKGTKLGVLVSFTTLAVGPTPTPTATTPTPAPTISPPPATKTIYLTFDDGPTQGYTNEVLADLKAAGAHATFFEIGQSTYTASGMCPGTASYTNCLNTAGNAGLVNQIIAAGNVVGTHSWDHPDFAALTSAQTATEISQARNLQITISGQDSKLFRFPYNGATQAGLTYLSGQGMRSAGADIDPSDWNWKQFTDTQVINAVMAQAKDGAVVQLHDGQDVLGRDGGHPGYLPLLLSELAANGYTFGTLSVSGTGSVFPAQKIASASNGA